MDSAGESLGEGSLYSNCTQVAVTYVKRALHHGFPRKTVDRESVIEWEQGRPSSARAFAMPFSLYMLSWCNGSIGRQEILVRIQN